MGLLDRLACHPHLVIVVADNRRHHRRTDASRSGVRLQ
jgi:hypothetical protein